ncbi:response regulator transcription factor [Streptomyces roseoviridis]|uniref:Response regulator n=1 Tax=Streptomyces roseoviridis TaxID=67361 RepID=A0ABV5QNJ4_9ACTN
MLAEDSTLLREGLVRLLAEEGHEVRAAVGNAVELLAAVEADPPDVVVADVRMPPTHTDEGLRAALEIRSRLPEVGVLVLSQYVEKRYATELLTGGAGGGADGGGGGGVGYLLKDRVAQVDEFLDALDRVGQGRTAFDPEVVRRLLVRSSHTDPLARLTPREAEVLAAMAQGHTNASVAARLHVSQSAVEKHINAIFDKLELTGRSDGYSKRVLAVLRYLDS